MRPPFDSGRKKPSVDPGLVGQVELAGDVGVGAATVSRSTQLRPPFDSGRKKPSVDPGLVGQVELAGDVGVGAA
ncbi:hypothetical protein C7E18_24035, partial [Stenotrophomonas maltophilia]